MRATSPSLLLPLLLAVVSIPAAGDFVPGTERVLLPISLAAPVSGAFGSLWQTDLAVTNSSSEPLIVEGLALPPCQLAPCPPPQIPPGVTFRSSGPAGLPGGIQGSFVHVEGGRSADLVLQLRVHDLSRGDRSWGTELPTVRESEFRTSALDLVDVPVTEDFRITLRIYSAGTVAAPVGVSVWGVGENLVHQFGPLDVLLGRRFFPWANPPAQVAARAYPAYVHVDGLKGVANIDGWKRVRVRIEPPAGSAVWAFISVTHNETQHVTTISPR